MCSPVFPRDTDYISMSSRPDMGKSQPSGEDTASGSATIHRSNPAPFMLRVMHHGDSNFCPALALCHIYTDPHD